MNNTIATIIKTWYTKNIYWCNWEYFNLQIIFIDWDIIENNKTYNFKWLYWVENRVQTLLKEKWIKVLYNQCNFWQLNKKDIYPNTLNETEILKELNILFTNNINYEY